MARCAILAMLAIVLSSTALAQRPSRHLPQPGAWGITLSAGLTGMGGDLTQVQSEYRYKPLGSILVTRQLRANFQLGAMLSGGMLGAERDLQRASSVMGALALHGEYRLPVGNGMLAPLAFVQIGVIGAAPDHLDDAESFADALTLAPFGGAGLGLDVSFHRRFGVRLMGGGMLTGTDKLDGIVSGARNDGVAWITLGVTWYLSGR